ncbi:MAG: T9SS type A sorting domain-containing protein [Bacteroidota bacterium]
MAMNSISTYTFFDIPITYDPPASSPDTVNIIAVSSAGYAPQLGSTLYIDDLSFVYDNPGVQEYSDGNSISVFPNPTAGFINILLDGGCNTVKVYNIVGEEIFRRQTSVKNLNIDLSGFPAGVYMLEVSGGTVKYFKKIILSR